MVANRKSESDSLIPKAKKKKAKAVEREAWPSDTGGERKSSTRLEAPTYSPPPPPPPSCTPFLYQQEKVENQYMGWPRKVFSMNKPTRVIVLALLSSSLT